MDVQLTPDQWAFARRAVESGRLRSEDEAVHEALALWEERERRRLALIASLDEAQAGAERGDGIVITDDSMRQLAEDIGARGRARLRAERS